MRHARTRLSSIGGALLAIAVVLAVAFHLAENGAGSAGVPSVAEIAGRDSGVSVVSSVIPLGSVIETCDASANGRARAIAYAVVPERAAQAQIETSLVSLAERVSRDHPGASAVMVLGYGSKAERAALSDAAPWSLVWSLDGRGWDGRSQNDFEKHICYRAR
ncbi:MAG TPA: hypothetical protein VM221_03805 [Armatimonadota bacterium]|nr:hypothetical protein [Armatimonadota bacterium]